MTFLSRFRTCDRPSRGGRGGPLREGTTRVCFVPPWGARIASRGDPAAVPARGARTRQLARVAVEGAWPEPPSRPRRGRSCRARTRHHPYSVAALSLVTFGTAAPGTHRSPQAAPRGEREGAQGPLSASHDPRNPVSEAFESGPQTVSGASPGGSPSPSPPYFRARYISLKAMYATRIVLERNQ